MNMLPPDTSFDGLVARAGVVALAVGLVWAALVLLAVGVEAVTRGRVRAARALGCPAGAHRRLLAVATAVLAAATVVPAAAQAAPAARAGGDGDARPAPVALDGLPLPDRAEGGLRATSRDRPRPRVSAVVTVRPGQSLWEISRSRLPARAAPDRIAALTRSLHRANRQVIGPDPDLIHPGQQLAVPPRQTTTDREDS